MNFERDFTAYMWHIRRQRCDSQHGNKIAQYVTFDNNLVHFAIPSAVVTEKPGEKISQVYVKGSYTVSADLLKAKISSLTPFIGSSGFDGCSEKILFARSL